MKKSFAWLTRRDALQAGGGEEVYGVTSAAFGGEVGQYFAHHAAELVAVTGETSRDGYLWMLRVRGDDEVFVGGVGVHAGRRVE